MFCKYCGKEIKDDTRFCPYCGKDQMPDEAEDTGANEDQAFKKQSTATIFSEKQNPEKQPARGDHATFKPGPVIAVIAVIAVVIVAVAVIFGVTRNSGTANETETVSEPASTNETGANGTESYSNNTAFSAWVVGEGRVSIGSATTASNNKASYQDQINTISNHFNDYEIADPYMDSAANASYRTFELLCVIAEELDSSGTYANAVAESATSRYAEMDAQTSYANIQVVNGLYRCAEMLASILYELEGNESISEIDSIMSAIISDPNANNFLECKQSATSAICQLLYYISFRLNLTDEDLDLIKNYYNEWCNNIDTIKSEKSTAIYDVNERQSLESLWSTYAFLYYTAGGLDSNNKYSNDKDEIYNGVANSPVQTINNYTLTNETEEALWEATLFDANMRLLGIIAELLAN